MGKKTTIAIYVLIAIALAVILLVTIVQLFHDANIMKYLGEPDELEAALDAYYTSQSGWKKAIVLIFLEFFIVIMGVFPAEPITIVTTISYGPYIGSIVCLIGVVAANCVMYFLFKKLGDGISKFYPSYQKWENKTFVRRKKGGRIINILFLYTLPIVPYGIIAIIASRSKLRFIPYLITTTIGVIPSIVATTFFAGSLLYGNYLTALLIAGIIGVAILIAYLVRRRFGYEEVQTESK